MRHRNMIRKSTSIESQQVMLKRELEQKMIEQYSTSQGYFYSKIIQNAIEKKQNDKYCIKIQDIKFDSAKQLMEKYYYQQDIDQEFPQLFEYYKYYSQDSICFLNRQFAFLSIYHEKKKAVLYEQLKKQLSITDSEDTMGSVGKLKPPNKYENVLSDLYITRNNDQSYLVAEILKKLVNHYGQTRVKTINKIDSQFNFFKPNLPADKYKNFQRQGLNNCFSNSKLYFQPANSSRKNNNFVMKQKVNKNPTHRRFGSCQIPKSALVRSDIQAWKQEQKQFKQFKQNRQIKQKKRTQIRKRRKSAQNIYYNTESNLAQTTSQNYKTSTIKTQQENKLSNLIGSKIIFSQNRFRNKMESIRNKIKQDKQNLIKKQQGNFFTRKKVKKV